MYRLSCDLHHQSFHVSWQQGYYRRGEAHFALGKHKAALKDFKAAARLAPKDADCRRKLAACEKEVKRIRFEEALATPVSTLAPALLHTWTSRSNSGHGDINILPGTTASDAKVYAQARSAHSAHTENQQRRNQRLLHVHVLSKR